MRTQNPPSSQGTRGGEVLMKSRSLTVITIASAAFVVAACGRQGPGTGQAAGTTATQTRPSKAPPYKRPPVDFVRVCGVITFRDRPMRVDIAGGHANLVTCPHA